MPSEGGEVSPATNRRLKIFQPDKLLKRMAVSFALVQKKFDESTSGFERDALFPYNLLRAGLELRENYLACLLRTVRAVAVSSRRSNSFAVLPACSVRVLVTVDLREVGRGGCRAFAGHLGHLRRCRCNPDCLEPGLNGQGRADRHR